MGKIALCTTHDTCSALLKDHDTFVRDPANAGKMTQARILRLLPRTLSLLALNMLGHDDPEHRRLRGLVDTAFQRRSIEAIGPIMQPSPKNWPGPRIPTTASLPCSDRGHVDAGGKEIDRYAQQRAIWRMAATAKGTVNFSNGQRVLRTVKNKDLLIPENELTPFLKALLAEQHNLCAITDLPLQFDGDEDDEEMLCSLDRIDSNGHYEKDNLQIVCRFVNRWKSSSHDDEFRRLLGLVRLHSA